MNHALAELEKLDSRQARTIEVRYFGGLTLEAMSLLADIDWLERS